MRGLMAKSTAYILLSCSIVIVGCSPEAIPIRKTTIKIGDTAEAQACWRRSTSVLETMYPDRGGLHTGMLGGCEHLPALKGQTCRTGVPRLLR